MPYITLTKHWVIHNNINTNLKCTQQFCAQMIKSQWSERSKLALREHLLGGALKISVPVRNLTFI